MNVTELDGKLIRLSVDIVKDKGPDLPSLKFLCLLEHILTIMLFFMAHCKKYYVRHRILFCIITLIIYKKVFHDVGTT